MIWQEYLIEACGNKPPLIVATATTGLSDETDQLIAIGYKTINAGDPVRSMMRRVPEDELVKARPYHRITRAASDNGLSDSQFEDRLRALIDSYTLFTYNPPFQRLFVSKHTDGTIPPMYNLPLLVKTAVSRQVFKSDPVGMDLADFETICYKMAGNMVGFKKQAALMGLMEFSGSLYLPHESAAMMMYDMWNRAAHVQIVVRGESGEA